MYYVNYHRPINVEKLITATPPPWKAQLYRALERPVQKQLECVIYRQLRDLPATVCQSRSRIRPSKTIRPSPRSDGNQDAPSRLRPTVKGSPDRVQRVVSLPDSPQSESRIATATAPVPQARVSASTPRSKV